MGATVTILFRKRPICAGALSLGLTTKESLVVAVTTQDLPPLLDGICKLRQNQLGIFPSYTGICNADAIPETFLAFFRHLLASYKDLVSSSIPQNATASQTFVDIRLDHNAHDSSLASDELLCERMCYLWLVLVLLL